MFLFTALFKFPVVTPYSFARSLSSITLCPLISWIRDSIFSGCNVFSIFFLFKRFSRRFVPSLLPQAASLQKSIGLFAVRSRPQNDNQGFVRSDRGIKQKNAIRVYTTIPISRCGTLFVCRPTASKLVSKYINSIRFRSEKC